MDLIQLIIILGIVGTILYLVNKYWVMDGTVKKIINIVVIIAVILFLLNLFGIFHGFPRIHVGG